MQAEDARLSTLRAEAESDLDSPSTSRQTSPSAHSSTTAAEQGYGGAKRRAGDDRQTLPRNIDRVYFGDYDIKTWYHSPYPLEDDHGSSSLSTTVTNGNARASSSSSYKHRGRQNGTASKSAASPAIGPLETGSHLTPPPSEGAQQKPKFPALWICEGCLKYMRTYAGWYAHKKDCQHTHPPGRKVYQRGSHTIWEVDGAKEKLYAQNLSLFGKLFIDHKTIYFDVEPFLFYVVTDSTANFDYVLGFFSKEKLSYDEYNLACIITFPPFQKKGFGTLMIELSYYLSAKAAIVGTPERPLSELGFKGYVSFWSAVVLRALALAFNEEDGSVNSKLLANAAASPTKAAAAASSPSANLSPMVSKAQQRAVVHVRSILLGLSDGPRPDLIGTDLLNAKDSDLTEEERVELKKAKRANLGFGKDLPPALASKFLAAFGSPPKRGAAARGVDGQGEGENEAGEGEANKEQSKEGLPAPPPLRTGPDRRARHSTPSLAKTANVADAPPHPALQLDKPSSSPFALCTTLERIAQATNLRVEDTAFALSELGLLKMRLAKVPKGVYEGGDEKPEGAEVAEGSSTMNAGVGGEAAGASSTASTSTGPGPVILITQEAVKEAVLRRKIKRPVLDTSYVFV
ncbi:acyl-CoA N-acyltransferase [Microstroma glucosiphilum]|uniref:histone acetyltransferase n=1 Tax=Pseudomicrostroma glucosiphilum TaxID=1684307 RepID=A0A316U8C8_9BASI|nr:acyl-CoA N-acyltransferase [Pseudomicrostroma glucosiphilum]PWN20721.1 acyl-CoA N-acyltransferase [Pseudomicrostroma glucosiphilum]